MADSTQPTNRKQRRAAARDKSSHLKSSPPDFKLEQPDRSGPKGKTLYDLAAERENLLKQGKPFWKPETSPSNNDDDFEPSDTPFGPFGDAMLYAASMAAIHLTFDVLANNQYRQDIMWEEIFRKTGAALPIFLIIVYLFHTETANKFKIAKQLLLMSIAGAAGSYLMYAGNTFGYYAVMERAPPLGTIWIWSVFELELPYALCSVAVVGTYALCYGYKPF